MTLAPDTLPIVVAPGWRGQGIGRRVILRLVDRARVLGWSELRVREVLRGTTRRTDSSPASGSCRVTTGPPAYVLRLAPLGGRPRP